MKTVVGLVKKVFKKIFKNEVFVFTLLFLILSSVFVYSAGEHISLLHVWFGKYPVHKKIFATTFWVGEAASDENDNIPNLNSAWDNHWMKHYGGNDTPDDHDGLFPGKFTPKENPFYFALPYNDFDQKGLRKTDVATVIPWYNKDIKKSESLLKNRWIRIKYNKNVCYAQWEDVGPFEENDPNYVFGKAQPIVKTAGIDMSPSLTDCLKMDNNDFVDWQFVDASDVPNGPWKQVVTTSQIDWKK